MCWRNQLYCEVTDIWDSICKKYLERMKISKYKKVHSFYSFFVENNNRTNCILQSVNSGWENAHTILISSKLFWLFFDGCLLRETSFWREKKHEKNPNNNLYLELCCTHRFYLKTDKNVLKYHGLWSQRKDVEMLEFFRQSCEFFKNFNYELHNLSGFHLFFQTKRWFGYIIVVPWKARNSQTQKIWRKQE